MTKSNHLLSQAKTLVIKIGSALICDKTGEQVRQDWFAALAQDLKSLSDQDKRIIIVSSGGVALGRKTLGISATTPPSQIPLAKKQAASAVGQYHMYNAYHTALSEHSIATAQVLLTLSETENRRQHLNARATLETLLEQGIIPIINENDSISTEEIRFGDNDRLAVRVAQMVGADHVLLMSTIDGLYTENPHENPTAKHIAAVQLITDKHKAMASEATPGLSTGGMKSKIQAAMSAVNSGIALTITDGQDSQALEDAIDGAKKSTLFLPKPTRSTARKSWIGSHLNPTGTITIDDGAAQALTNGKSLLPIGVTSISGDFERGDIVTVHNSNSDKIATGISAYSAQDAKHIIGKPSLEILEKLGYTGRSELIHRNDLVLSD